MNVRHGLFELRHQFVNKSVIAGMNGTFYIWITDTNNIIATTPGTQNPGRTILVIPKTTMNKKNDNNDDVTKTQQYKS